MSVPSFYVAAYSSQYPGSEEYAKSLEAGYPIPWPLPGVEPNWQDVLDQFGNSPEGILYFNRLKWSAQWVLRQRKKLQSLIDSPDTDPAERVSALQQLQELN